MNEKCKKCVYYSGDDVLLPHCFHLNSAIVPGWNQYYEDKECPEFVDKEDYYNKLKEFLEANIEDFIQTEAKENKTQAEQQEQIESFTNNNNKKYIGKYVHAGGEWIYLDDIDMETYKKNGSIPIECYECSTIFYLEK